MEPMFGLIIVGPVLGPLFALLGALSGFVAGFFAWLLYVVSGGKLGSKRIASMGNPLKSFTSPLAMTLMSVFGVFAGWLATGIFMGVWSFVRQMEDLSAYCFGSPDLGPLKAIVGLFVGLTVGRIVAARALSAPSTTAAAKDDKAVPPAAAVGCCGGNAIARLTVRCLTVAAFAYVGVYLGTAVHTGNWNPASQPRDIVAWFKAPIQETVEIKSVDAWPGYRGGSARTGSLDNHPGPIACKVLWVYKGGLVKFLASPAVVGDYVFSGGTDGGTGGYVFVFNAALVGEGKQQLARREKFPFSVYSPPAVIEGMLVMGEGLHEDKKTRLRCLDINDNARVLWELEVPSHLESGAAVVDGKVYIGAGDEGVLCVDLKRVTAGPTIAEARTIKPTKDEDGFDVIPVPVVHWRNNVSADGVKMHVDTSPAVAGGAVVVGSGKFEEHGQTIGDRAVICLNAADGKVRWRTPVDRNPWGSPAIVGDKVLVGCSSERFEVDKLARSKGEVVCLSLTDGKILWRKEAGGGVLSSVAIAGGKTVVFCAADGSVTALDLDGKQLWQTKPAGAFMAAPTISGGYVYVADVACTVTALKLADGVEVWKLKLADDPNIRGAGTVIGSPAAAGGRLFLGTDGGYFVAIGEK